MSVLKRKREKTIFWSVLCFCSLKQNMFYKFVITTRPWYMYLCKSPTLHRVTLIGTLPMDPNQLVIIKGMYLLILSEFFFKLSGLTTPSNMDACICSIYVRICISYMYNLHKLYACTIIYNIYCIMRVYVVSQRSSTALQGRIWQCKHSLQLCFYWQHFGPWEKSFNIWYFFSYRLRFERKWPTLLSHDKDFFLSLFIPSPNSISRLSDACAIDLCVHTCLFGNPFTSFPTMYIWYYYTWNAWKD